MRLTRCFCFVLVILAMTVFVSGQTVDEYKTAAEAMNHKEGCTSIPMADIRDKCTRASDFVEQECKRKEFGCKGLENKELAANIKGKEDAIESMKRQKSALDSERSDAMDSEKAQIERSGKALDDRIARELSGLEEMKKALATDRSDSDIRAEQGKRCLEARNDVQALFASASSAAKSESDAEKKPFADDLVKYWEQGARDHEEAQKTDAASDRLLREDEERRFVTASLRVMLDQVRLCGELKTIADRRLAPNQRARTCGTGRVSLLNKVGDG